MLILALIAIVAIVALTFPGDQIALILSNIGHPIWDRARHLAATHRPATEPSVSPAALSALRATRAVWGD